MAARTKDHPFHSFLAGAFAGSVEATITYPTEFVKTQLQLQSKSGSKVASQFSGPVDCLVKTVRQNGITALYRGLTPMVIGTGAKAAVRFLSYEQFKRLFTNEGGQLTKPRLLLAGLCAGMTEAVLVVTPSETIKTKLIDDSRRGANRRYQGMVHGITQILRDDGFRGIYQGVSAVMLRQGANQMVRFGTYGTLKEIAASNLEGSVAVHPGTTFVIGMAAGVVTVYTTMPFDVIKTKMQSLEANQYKSTIDCFIKTAKSEGVKAFWKGATPRLSRLLFSGGIVFTVYEEAMKVLRKL
ncbi:mitochondrial inner membrane citrate transporter [Paraphysoderma sedebokerense]|nr:mitochondrial inner membrane citrate transporter [Paraphysoderma sedebokerense]